MGGVTVVYDGECVFCANFARLMRLRETFGTVTLVDARDGKNPLIADLRRRHMLNDGFVVIHDGVERYGSEAAQFVALASSDDAFGKCLRLAFRAPRLARSLYPATVAVRKLLLRLRGLKELAY